MRASSLLRPSLPQNLMETLTLVSPPFLGATRFLSPLRRRTFLRSHLSATAVKSIPISDDALMGFITGKRKATAVAHSVWKNIVQKGDTVIDATCDNGYDTLALLKMVADESGKGCVYGMDIQGTALESTSSLLEELADQNEGKLVNLALVCHSKMEMSYQEIHQSGGDKTIITISPTTLLALQAASRMLETGGLISMVVYVGHPGGRDELETVQSFASSLPMESWISCKLQPALSSSSYLRNETPKQFLFCLGITLKSAITLLELPE